ncbi:MAG: hypothetical protein GY759_19665 [Chloroflexi bacterium]|nr:hypothetical protein [Chloroflexota bacterium]
MSDSEQVTFSAFARLVLDAVENAKITYLIGGSVALAVWGEARTTRDIDLVIELPLESMADLSAELEKRDMLVPVEVMLDLLIEYRADLPINAIHMYSGYKAEFYLLKPGDAFRSSNLARRRLVDLGPPLGEVYVHAPEDLILNKLHFYDISHQPKHIRDIASIVLSQEDALDHAYIDEWARQLDVTDIWLEVLRQIEDI